MNGQETDHNIEKHGSGITMFIKFSQKRKLWKLFIRENTNTKNYQETKRRSMKALYQVNQMGRKVK